MLRFFLMFLAIQGVLFTLELTPAAQQVLVQPFTGLLATLSGHAIDLLGRPVVISGVLIQDQLTPFAVEIAAGCNGIEAVIILVAAVLAFPAPWGYKLVGVLVGILAIQALNLIRIVSLYLLGLWNQTAFEWAHLYVWQALIMLDVLLIWLLWIRALPGRDGSARTL